jgi:hypothetical protein
MNDFSNVTRISNVKFALIYTLLIVGLGGYAFYLQQQKTVWLGFAEEILRSHKETKVYLDKINNFYVVSVESRGLQYPSEQAFTILRQAKATYRLCSEFLDFTEKIRQKHRIGGNNNGELAFKGLLNTEEKTALIQQMHQLRDSFCLFAQKDTSILHTIKPRLNIEHDLLNTYREDQKLLYLASLDVQVLLAARDLLHFWHFQADQYEFRWDSLMPNITLEQPCIRAGEPFYGVASLNDYSTSFEYVTYYCNDIQLPVQDGLGKMRLKITPKTRKYSIKAVIKNPATGQIEGVKKDFSIDLCKE